MDKVVYFCEENGIIYSFCKIVSPKQINEVQLIIDKGDNLKNLTLDKIKPLDELLYDILLFDLKKKSKVNNFDSGFESCKKMIENFKIEDINDSPIFTHRKEFEVHFDYIKENILNLITNK